jgi:hypothetical protein
MGNGSGRHYCTKMLVKWELKTYEPTYNRLNLFYRKPVPEVSGGSGFGIGGGLFHITDVQNIDYTDTDSIDIFGDKSAVKNKMNEFRNGLCLKCGDASQCPEWINPWLYNSNIGKNNALESNKETPKLLESPKKNE